MSYFSYSYLSDIIDILDEYDKEIDRDSTNCSGLLSYQIDEVTRNRYRLGKKKVSRKILLQIVTRIRFLWMKTIIRKYSSEKLDSLFFEIYKSLLLVCYGKL